LAQPPWGAIQAFDLRNGKLKWRQLVGTARDSGPLGLPTGLPFKIGTPQFGGTVVTEGGLTFSSGTADQYLRAYRTSDGLELWRARLPAGGQASPMTYVARNGRQYVVIVAGGSAMMGTKTGDHVLAFAIPED
jgi:quinoprotein glucose dehydrogenase